MSSQKTLGADLRAIRKSRRLTLEAVAERLGKSVGWLSQVERDISQPDLADLQHMATVFEVPVSLFFGTPDGPGAERGKIVRANGRRIIGERSGGPHEALLSPDLTDDFEVIHSTFQPGAALTKASHRQTQEIAYLISGKLDIWLDDDAFTVGEGDAFRIRNQRFRWANPYDAPAVAVWVISPPIY